MQVAFSVEKDHQMNLGFVKFAVIIKISPDSLLPFSSKENYEVIMNSYKK
jgi:hypothetical protein